MSKRLIGLDPTSGPLERKDERALPARPEHAGRFAPLLGLLVDEVAESPHGIDFLHPRRRPAPPNATRRNVLIGATVAAAVGYRSRREMSGQKRPSRLDFTTAPGHKMPSVYCSSRGRDLPSLV